MCISPLTIYVGPKGDKTPVETACHECWQCIENAVNDWVGRNIAESKTAVGTHAVTLTYGRTPRGEVDHEAAAILTYSDVQKYLKLLRRHGLPVRYFVTGEYGSTKGRAHWHIMLYWQKVDPTRGDLELRRKWFTSGVAWRNDPDSDEWVSKPYSDGEIPLDWNFRDEYHWPHGWSFWTRPTHDAVRYNCKYIQKGMGDAERQGHLAMSKKPPIGAVYFRNLAERHVEQGLAPQTLEYSFPEVRKQSGEARMFMLKDRSAELYLEHYLRTWSLWHPKAARPESVLLDEYLDAVAREEMASWHKAKDDVWQKAREKLRARVAAEMSALLIEQVVQPREIDMSGADPEFTLAGRIYADGSRSFDQRWRYDNKARKWQPLRWKFGKGWHRDGEE